mgnify:FL=1|jgi:hypothetical protein
MKPGDLVRRRRKGWLAVVVSVDEMNQSAMFYWVNTSGGLDECSMSLLEVVNETR